jgi:hypothetical protein
MRTVYKYPLHVDYQQTIRVSREVGVSSKIVHVGLDPTGMPCVWVENRPGPINELFVIFVVGTGQPIPENTEHVGSFVQGSYVWHAYLQYHPNR